jgi:hypothetical protein
MHFRDPLEHIEEFLFPRVEHPGVTHLYINHAYEDFDCHGLLLPLCAWFPDLSTLSFYGFSPLAAAPLGRLRTLIVGRSEHIACAAPYFSGCSVNSLHIDSMHTASPGESMGNFANYVTTLRVKSLNLELDTSFPVVSSLRNLQSFEFQRIYGNTWLLGDLLQHLPAITHLGFDPTNHNSLADFLDYLRDRHVQTIQTQRMRLSSLAIITNAWTRDIDDTVCKKCVVQDLSLLLSQCKEVYAVSVQRVFWG